jgi:starch synthase (maltosyl-transferring)
MALLGILTVSRQELLQRATIECSGRGRHGIGDGGGGEAALGHDAEIVLAPGEAKILLPSRSAPIRPAAAVPAAAVAARALPRLAIEAVNPAVDDGRFAAKRTVGEVVEVGADLVCDGHDRLAAALLWRPADEAEWRAVRMRPLGNDRWGARFPLERVGPPPVLRRGVARRLRLLPRRAGEEARRRPEHRAGAGGGPPPRRARRRAGGTGAGAPDAAALRGHGRADARGRRAPLPQPQRQYPVEADRTRARFASWYALFPRSQSGDPRRRGTFADVIR